MDNTGRLMKSLSSQSDVREKLLFQFLRMGQNLSAETDNKFRTSYFSFPQKNLAPIIFLNIFQTP